MSKTFHHGERRIRVHGIRRVDPDLRRLARALIDLAQAEAEADAQREFENAQRLRKATRKSRSTTQRRRKPRSAA